jgi:hypothetical protein
MVISEIVTLFLYVISIAFLPEYFGQSPVSSPRSVLTLRQICPSLYLFDSHGRSQ